MTDQPTRTPTLSHAHEPGRLALGALVTGDLVWSAGQIAAVGLIEYRTGTERPIVVELWHIGATAPDVIHGRPGDTVQVDSLVQVDEA